MIVLALFALLMAAQFADWWSSKLASRAPNSFEDGKIMGPLMRRFGFKGAFVAKTLAVDLVGGFFLYASGIGVAWLAWLCWAVMAATIALYVRIIHNNLRIAATVKGNLPWN